MEEKSKETVKKCYVHEDNVLNKPQLGFTKLICDNTDYVHEDNVLNKPQLGFTKIICDNTRTLLAFMFVCKKLSENFIYVQIFVTFILNDGLLKNSYLILPC